MFIRCVLALTLVYSRPFIIKGMILTDVTGDDSPKPMTKELLKKIFIFYKGELVSGN